MKMNIVLEIFESFFLPHEDPKPLESVGLQKAHCRQLSRFALSRPVLQGDAACIALSPKCKKGPVAGTLLVSMEPTSGFAYASGIRCHAAGCRRPLARSATGRPPACPLHASRPYRFESPSLPNAKRAPRCRDPPRFDGANERIRTADLRITSALLYQLSHVGISCG